MKDEVIILRSEYEELQRNTHFLACLEGAGVDNWDGYEYAQRAYRKKYPEDE